MPEKGPGDETQRDEDDAANQPLGGLRSRLAGGLDRGRQAANQGIQRSREIAAESVTRADETLTRSAEQAGLSDQLEAARRGVRRSSEVLTGADISRLDEFTDAVTRVALGLHRDQVEQASRLTQFELTVDELRRDKAKMAERLAELERIVGNQSGGDADGVR